MQYSRAQRDDFASWATPGWTADDLLPLMKRLETYHGPGSLDVHGTDGPIHVSTSSYGAPRPRDQFISVLKDQGWPEVKDLSSLDTCNGVQKSLRYTSPDGKRQDTASRYLLPRVNDGKHPNLHVAVSSQVVRVLFDGKKASGVVFRSKQQQDGAVATERTVKARKLVVISAGAFGTPAILERSGIGNPEVLKRAGIPEVIADVPGVGAEYEDHNLLLYAYKSSLEPEETIDAMMRGIWKAEDLITSNHGILGWNGQEATAKIRPTEEDVASFDPDLKKLWEEEYKDNPNKPLMILTLLCG
jgi:alcohol oxidase